jgi:hypothetical protein
MAAAAAAALRSGSKDAVFPTLSGDMRSGGKGEELLHPPPDDDVLQDIEAFLTGGSPHSRGGDRRAAPDPEEAIYYLPKNSRGIAVMRDIGNGLWQADNTKFRGTQPGIAYRKSKTMDDKADGDPLLAWGCTVRGKSAGADWVKVKYAVEDNGPGPDVLWTVEELMEKVPDLPEEQAVEIIASAQEYDTYINGCGSNESQESQKSRANSRAPSDGNATSESMEKKLVGVEDKVDLVLTRLAFIAAFNGGHCESC